MATAPIYCTHKELKRVFPQLNEFDGKKIIYGWTYSLANWYDTSIDAYYSTNCGLITQLYWDGREVEVIAYNTTETTQLAAIFSASETGAVDVDSATSFGANDIVKIDNEYMRLTAVNSDSGNTITAATPLSNRGLFGTSPQHHAVNASVYKIIDVTADVGDATGQNEPYSFVYDSDLDICILITETDPSDNLVEAGEDFTGLVTQFRTDASRYLDSRLDPNLPKEQLKDKSGNFDYMIIRTTALIAASFMIKTKDPNSEMAASFMEEAEKNITDMNNGNAALSWQNTSDASKGVIRDVTYTGTVRPVDTRGRWSGTYDLIKVKIDTTGGAIGTATYSVWVKDGDKLGMNEGTQVVTTEVINGDYQALSGGLQIRFAGTNFDSTAAVNDTWEIEVTGFAEEVDSSSLKPIRMTRRWQ